MIIYSVMLLTALVFSSAQYENQMVFSACARLTYKF